MTMMKALCLIIALIFLVEFIVAEVTVLKVVQTIYDRSPKLRIRGSGFDADEHSIILDISAQGCFTDYLLQFSIT